jgi:hypothetical protein
MPDSTCDTHVRTAHGVSAMRLTDAGWERRGKQCGGKLGTNRIETSHMGSRSDTRVWRSGAKQNTRHAIQLLPQYSFLHRGVVCRQKSFRPVRSERAVTAVWLSVTGFWSSGMRTRERDFGDTRSCRSCMIAAL